MPLRLLIVAAALLVAETALAEPMTAEAARRFIVGKTFAYSCFDGTRGSGRIFNDGSAIGTIQNGGAGATKMAALPPGSLRVKGDMVCATLRGMPIDPCFNLTRTNANSFRGAISGLGFAYCDFTTRQTPPAIRTTLAPRPATAPMKIEAPAAAAQAPGAEVTGSTTKSSAKAVE